MRGKEQEKEMLKKMQQIIKILPTCKSIKEISEQTKIPTSTIQRYLNKEELLIDIISKEELTFIKNWLINAKKEGIKKGCTNSQEKNSYLKDDKGKFIGNKKNK